MLVAWRKRSFLQTHQNNKPWHHNRSRSYDKTPANKVVSKHTKQALLPTLKTSSQIGQIWIIMVIITRELCDYFGLWLLTFRLISFRHVLFVFVFNSLKTRKTWRTLKDGELKVMSITGDLMKWSGTGFALWTEFEISPRNCIWSGFFVIVVFMIQSDKKGFLVTMLILWGFTFVASIIHSYRLLRLYFLQLEMFITAHFTLFSPFVRCIYT